MDKNTFLPLVGIPTSYATEDERGMHRVGGNYSEAVCGVSNCTPVLIPALGGEHCFDTLVGRLDGLFLTGGAPNVEPRHYGGPPSRKGTLHDPKRDATVLPLIRAAIDAGLPVFAVCLGIQELNVALGGTLHPLVHELPGKNEHRMDRTLPMGERQHARHPIMISPGGMMEKLTGGAKEVMVNSLHAQAIDRPADPLFVEAVSDDDVIEAVSMPSAKGYVLGVQWHPEGKQPLKWPLSDAMFKAFGDACRAHCAARENAHRDERAA
jgi:putative glutamine amidotransferase